MRYNHGSAQQSELIQDTGSRCVLEGPVDLGATSRIVQSFSQDSLKVQLSGQTGTSYAWRLPIAALFVTTRETTTGTLRA